MPYTACYVDDGKGVHKTGHGLITGFEIIAGALQEAKIQERSRKLRYFLVDFSDVTEMQVTPEDVRRIIEMNHKTASFVPDSLVAIVAPSALPYAMSRLWHTLSDDLSWKSNVFHTRQDAFAWLRKQMLTRHDPATIRQEFPSLGWPELSELEEA